MNTPEMRRVREELREKTALLRAGGFSRESASKSQSRSKERDPKQSSHLDEGKQSAIECKRVDGQAHERGAKSQGRVRASPRKQQQDAIAAAAALALAERSESMEEFLRKQRKKERLLMVINKGIEKEERKLLNKFTYDHPIESVRRRNWDKDVSNILTDDPGDLNPLKQFNNLANPRMLGLRGEDPIGGSFLGEYSLKFSYNL